MQQPFGEERFTFSLLLVLFNRVVTCSVALSVLLVRGLELRPVAPARSYAGVSLSNVAATFCQYEALRHVSFAVQTLGKCAKMLPVMVWGTLINRKRYGARDYASAAAVMAGCSVFLMSGESGAHRAGVGSSSLFGVALMAGYLGFDGFTSTSQDALFKGYDMTIFNQMLYITAFSATFSLGALVASGQLMPGVAFMARHPDALVSALTLSASATVGQMFISHTIKTYGALLFAIAMTTRQFVSILLSAIIFRHAMTRGQIAGTVVVFSTLFATAFARGRKKPAPRSDVEAAEVGGARSPESKAHEGSAVAQERTPFLAVHTTAEEKSAAGPRPAAAT